MAPVIVKACMVPRARHLHSWWYTTPDIGRLIKSDAMKIDAISRKNPHSHVRSTNMAVFMFLLLFQLQQLGAF